MTATPFEPVTKQRAAQILSVAIRTIDLWISIGEMPAPRHIGRRAYWHPSDFNGWLDKRLKSADDTNQSDGPGIATSRPAQDEPGKKKTRSRNTSASRPQGNDARVSQAKQRAHRMLDQFAAS